MKITEYSQLRHGMKVRCKIGGKQIDDAKISINPDGDAYICQNEKSGCPARDKLGYKYSWWLAYKNDPMSEWSSSVTDLESVALKELPNTVVHCPTQEIYDNLMRIYEDAGWRWCSGSMPTAEDYWPTHKEKACVNVVKYFGHSRKQFYESINYRIISFDEFLREQGMLAKNMATFDPSTMFIENGVVFKKPSTPFPPHFMDCVTSSIQSGLKALKNARLSKTDKLFIKHGLKDSETLEWTDLARALYVNALMNDKRREDIMTNIVEDFEEATK